MASEQMTERQMEVYRELVGKIRETRYAAEAMAGLIADKAGELTEEQRQWLRVPLRVVGLAVKQGMEELS